MGAFVGAFLGRKLAHYPRFPDADGNWRQVTDSEMMARVSSGLSQLSHDDSRLHDAVKAGRETLDEVKRSEEHTSELQSLMRISYAVFCLKKKIKSKNTIINTQSQNIPTKSITNMYFI